MEEFYDFPKLLGVSRLVPGDDFEPRIEIERTKKRVGPVIAAQVPGGVLLEKGKRLLAYSRQGLEHGSLVADQARVERDGGLTLDSPPLGKEYRDMESSPQR